MNRVHPWQLVIFGPQGSGKGTQAELLAQKFDLVHIGWGDVLRKMAMDDTPLGKQIDEIVNQRGLLVPDDVASEIARLKIGDIPPGTGFILDGYPRTVAQAEQLHQILATLGRAESPTVFITLEVPETEAVRRLEKRREQEGRRDDVGPAIQKRLELYNEKTKPVLAAVGSWAQVVHVDGNQEIADVTASIIAKLERNAAKA